MLPTTAHNRKQAVLRAHAWAVKFNTTYKVVLSDGLYMVFDAATELDTTEFRFVCHVVPEGEVKELKKCKN